VSNGTKSLTAEAVDSAFDRLLDRDFFVKSYRVRAAGMAVFGDYLE
jgi:hypothetical protein